MRLHTVMLVFLLCAACSKKKSAPATSDAFLPPKELAELKDRRLGEVSGVAASVANPGLLWVHNDSGNPAVVYLVDETLEVRLSVRLKDVKNRDWEDIAVGPGPEEGKQYVYIADIGDNNGRHEEKFVYRFEEPKADDKNKEITLFSFDTITFRLPDEKKDTEAIIVHPRSKDIYIISKREKPVHVYQLKYPFGNKVITAKTVTTLPLKQIVAADISPDGEEVIMKDYDNIYYWPLKGRSLLDALQEKPLILAYSEEPQGEAIGFKTDGSGFYTLSETLKGERTFLYFYARNPGVRQ